MLLIDDSELLRDRGYIDGAWAGADSGATFPVYDPASGEVLARVPRMGAAETRRAIEAASAALPTWRARPARERAAFLRAFADLMLRHRRDLAMIMTREQGKPLAESDAEIGYAASFLEWMGEEAKRVYGDTIPAPQTDTRIVVLKQPVGVCGGITPWNFPSAMITRKAAPALAAGNTIVCKPAEQTPLSALALAELADRVGIPAGIFQIVTGDAEDAPAIGGELTGNPIVRKIGFTGSTAVGKILMAQCAGQVKKLSLELGGNAPFLVFDDAELDKAVAGAIICKFRNAGQVCIAANRLLVQDGIHDAFVERYAQAIGALRVGLGTEQGVNVGPLIDQQGLDKVVAHVEDARAKGAEVLLGGGPHERGGLFFEPTLLTGVTDDMAMSQDETFGPVAGIRRFGDEEEGIRLANDTPYGLAAYFYSRDVGRVWRVGEGLDYGIVGINTGFVSTEVAPFGGMKESGIGREGSKYGIEDWLEIKYLAMGGIDR
jgi:succinate-semialdehyde dehydrogenase/glutarate-semialdehyde dehydrogenase